MEVSPVETSAGSNPMHNIRLVNRQYTDQRGIAVSKINLIVRLVRRIIIYRENTNYTSL